MNMKHVHKDDLRDDAVDYQVGVVGGGGKDRSG